MDLIKLLGFNFGSKGSSELPDIFPFPTVERDFVSIDVKSLYTRILKDVVERTDGIKEDQEILFWDNCLGSEAKKGLVNLVATAMTDQKELYLVYTPSTNVIMIANDKERELIKADYLREGKSSQGVYMTFQKMELTTILKIYSGLEYCILASLWKNMNLAKSIQIKVNGLRSDVSLADKTVAESQAQKIADALCGGRPALLDAKDMIETGKPDLDATTASMEFVNQKRAFYTGLPESYITGVQSKGMGDSGMKDAKAVDRGLKPIYFWIIRPLVLALFETKTTFKSQDVDQLDSANETLKTFEITSDEFLSKQNKQVVINKLYGLPSTEQGGSGGVKPSQVTATIR